MTQSSATDASRKFSKLLRQVVNGDRVTITKDGKPIALLVPAEESEAQKRRTAHRRLMEMLRQGLPIGYCGPLDRAELHKR